MVYLFLGLRFNVIYLAEDHNSEILHKRKLNHNGNIHSQIIEILNTQSYCIYIYPILLNQSQVSLCVLCIPPSSGLNINISLLSDTPS